jgi:hypothetical protein
MTSTAAAPVRSNPLVAVAAASAGLALAVTAIGIVEPLRDREVGPSWSEWILFDIPVIVTTTVLVFLLVVRRGLARGNPTLIRSALVLGVIAVLSLAVFWSGLPCVLAGGTGLCAVEARARGAGLAGTIAALGMAAFTVAIAGVAAFGG